MTNPNFARLDADRPEVSRLMIAMMQAREALSHRSWSHPIEYAGEEWWADVLADPRARRQTRGSHSRGALTIYRLRTSQARSSWSPAPSAIGRRRTAATNLSPCTVLIAPCPICWTILLHRAATGSGRIWIAAARILLSRWKERDDHAHPTPHQGRLYRDWSRHRPAKFKSRREAKDCCVQRRGQGGAGAPVL
jgi:hypothetical protein